MAPHIKSEEPEVVPESSQSSLSAVEKGNVAITSTVDLDHAGETKGYVLDEETLKDQLQLAPDAILKKSKNGKVVLIPQPTDDPQVLFQVIQCHDILITVGFQIRTLSTGQNGRNTLPCL